jgi:pyrimidine operon attenuation protein/uracil phosphoribosyltransferase
MILDKQTADRKLRRIALEISERNYDKSSLLLIGIKANGIFIAEKIAAYLKDSFSGEIEVVSLQMDKKKPTEIILDKPIDFNGRDVVLVDDVANSGKTFFYALKPMMNQHPSKVETVALVERTYKKFPIAINYVGLSVATAMNENIIVNVVDGEIIGAYIENN